MLSQVFADRRTRTHLVTAGVLALIGALLLALSGCSLAPRQRFVLAGETYAVTVTELAAYRAAGELDEQTVARIEAARLAARAALDAWAMALLAEDAPSLEGVAEAVEALLDALILELEARQDE